MTGALGRRSFWCQFSKRVNQRVFIAFLRKLLKKRKKVLLLLDNARWHRGKKVKAWAAANRHRLKFVFFLPYTPELNPVEPCWKDIKKELGNKLFYTTGGMKRVIRKRIKNKDFFVNKMFQYLCS